MKLTELKALDKLAKSDKTYDFLQHVFIMGGFLYACTPYIVVEVFCKELKDRIEPKFKTVDMDKAETLNNERRFVPLAEIVSDESGYWDKWECKYFAKFFDMKQQHNGTYDSKYLIKIIQIFKTFKCNIRFVINERNKIVTFEGFNGNYEIRALLMPLR